MKLTSMTERVLSEIKVYNNTCYAEDESALNQLKKKLENHVDFLIQKLELWMFVPCKFVEGIWVVLDHPDVKEQFYRDHYDGGWWNSFVDYKKECQEAKDRVLFEGFEIKEYSGKLLSVEYKGVSVFFKIPVKEWYTPNGFDAIEDLVKYNLELTPTAQKQIGL